MLAADFLSDLQADIAAFEAALSGQQAGKQTHVAATDGIGETADEIISIVKQLHAAIRNKFRDQPDILAAWESAQHTKRPPRRKHKSDEPPTAEHDTQSPKP